MNENVNQEPESFIVQNVTLGPHYVSDIRLNFGPLQAIDLTWEDPKVVKASKDLRNSLRLGLLRKISPEQFDNIEEKAAIRGKKELLRQQNANRRLGRGRLSDLLQIRLQKHATSQQLRDKQALNITV